MHDLLMEHQGALTVKDLIHYAADLGLNTGRFTDDLRRHAGAARVAEDVDSADLSGVTGTPTLFVNGRTIGNVSQVPAEVLKSLVDFAAKQK